MIVIAMNLMAILPRSAYAKPCECKDIDALSTEIQRANTAEAIWKEIFAWARGLRNDVAEPQSNDELNRKFLQLARSPRFEWDRLIKEPSPEEQPVHVGSLNDLEVHRECRRAVSVS
jgi:hypothetical protein